MSKKSILIEWPSLNAKVECREIEYNRALFEKFCEYLPFNALQIHAMVAGYQMYHYAPMILDDYVDLIEKSPPLDKVPDGSLLWTGLGLIGLTYGHNTEYLATQPIAQVKDEDMEILRCVGRRVWEAVMYTKEIIEVRYSLIEGGCK